MTTRILVLTLGGTIDAKAITGEYPKYTAQDDKNAAFQALLQIRDSLNKGTTFDQSIIANKDSKNLDEKDFSRLENEIQHAHNYDRIIVTIGTDRLAPTAKEIQEKFESGNLELPCPVIFTGAMWPIANGPDKSDGFANLKAAAYQHTNLQKGVYIAGSGLFHHAQYVEKDFENLTFILTSNAPDFHATK